jgi:hypothetical protein
MIRNKMVYISLTVAVVAVIYFGWKLTARGLYESAEYAVLESDGAFEIREYPPLMMVTTNMQFEAQGNDGSFMRLFRYISGANDADQKVAMTTPVFMQPVADETAGQMGFVIPRKVAAEQIPEPSGGSVQIRERVGGRFAVVRFNGRLNRGTFAAAEERLRSWLMARGLRGKAEVETAGYDPPWTPGPLRRNEVLIRLP